MLIRLGYVSLSKCLDITPSSNITYTNYINNNYDINKLYEIIDKNLNNLKELCIYNIKNNIHFYRLTSKLIPLATHNKINYDYITPFKDKFNEIGLLIKDMRIDTHPDQYAVLNSMDKRIVNNTFEILEYHYKILNAFNIKDKIIILHVGSSACGKDKSITRFINNFNKLPNYLKDVIALENDDKIYNIKDVLYICKTLNIPMVLDYHHFICNNEGENINDYLLDIFNTWQNKTPKIHFSTPKSKLKKEFRSHNDYIDCDDFISFINILKNINRDVDIMLEAKAKDDALFRLVRCLKYKTNYNFIDESSFYV